MTGKRARYSGLALACLALVFCSAALANPTQPPAFRFAVIGDTRIQGLPDRSNQFDQPQMFLDTIREINLLDYDLVLDVGDLILGNVEQPADIERMWDNFDAAWHRFAMPAKMVVGNHDIWNLLSDAIYRRRYGNPTYPFDMGGCHFVVLNSEDVPDNVNYVRGEQLDWLKQDLDANKDAAHIFVFLHKPLWEYDPTRSNWWADVHPLLARYGVDAVFAGHDHRYRECTPADGVRYFVTGGGGAEMQGGPAVGAFYHHMAVSVRGDEVRYAVVKTGNVVPTDVVSDRSLAAMAALFEALGGMAAYLQDVNEPAQVFVVARNEHSVPMQGSLVWKVPANWSVAPKAVPLSLQSGEDARILFTVTATDESLFPLPEYTVTVWWGAGNLSTETRPLTLLNDWFLRQWHIVGPFDLWPEGEQAVGDEPPGFAKVYPPERGIDLSQRYDGAAGEVVWKPVTAPADGYLDLRANLQPSHQMIAYATTTVNATRDADAVLSLGSNDGAKVWVNGEPVYSKHIGRAAQPHEEQIPIRLREGPNQLLLKVENWGAAWGFYAAIIDLDGTLLAPQ